jgi:hypothetical protein
MSKFLVGMALSIVLWSPSAFASVAGGVLDLDAVRAQQAGIHADATARRGVYKDMPASKRADLLVRQAGLLRLLEGKKTADDLSEVQRVDVFNRLEWIEAAINGTDDERMICHREKTIGSSRVVRVCRTVQEERRMKETARDRMDHLDPLGRR